MNLSYYNTLLWSYQLQILPLSSIDVHILQYTKQYLTQFTNILIRAFSKI